VKGLRNKTRMAAFIILIQHTTDHLGYTEFKTSLGYIVNPCNKQTKNNTTGSSSNEAKKFKLEVKFLFIDDKILYIEYPKNFI
jgi:hypothetical protein